MTKKRAKLASEGNPIKLIGRVAFATTFAASFALLAAYVSDESVSPYAAISAIVSGDLSSHAISREFAYGLAWTIACAGFGLACAYLVSAIAIPLWLIRSARKKVQGAGGPIAFASSVDAITQDLVRNPVIGHEWQQYERTLRRSAHDSERGILHATSRPGAFLNLASLRESVPSLKLLPAIPGYFVGVGLLLTFVGLVLALSKAGQAVSSSDAQGMQLATRELLQTATFKFSTSIAGLGTSIGLSVFAKVATTLLEVSLAKLCRAVEANVQHDSAAALSASLRDAAEEQVTQLKTINSSIFADKFGESVSSHIRDPIQTALGDLIETIRTASVQSSGTAMGKVEALLEKLNKNLEEKAGDSLTEVLRALDGVRGGLQGVASDIAEGGRALRGDLANGISDTLGDTVGRLEQSLGHVVRASASHAASLEAVGERSQAAADAFRDTADGLRTAAKPIADAGAAIGRMVDGAHGAIDAVSRSVRDQADAASAIADKIGEQSDRLLETWDKYGRHLEGAEAELAKTADLLAQAAESHRNAINQHVSDVDRGFAKAIDNLNGAVSTMGDTAVEIADQIEAISRNLSGRASP